LELEDIEVNELASSVCSELRFDFFEERDSSLLEVRLGGGGDDAMLV